MTFRDWGRPAKPLTRGSASGPRSRDFRPQTFVHTLHLKPSPQIALVFNDSIIQLYKKLSYRRETRATYRIT